MCPECYRSVIGLAGQTVGTADTDSDLRVAAQVAVEGASRVVGWAGGDPERAAVSLVGRWVTDPFSVTETDWDAVTSGLMDTTDLTRCDRTAWVAGLATRAARHTVVAARASISVSRYRETHGSVKDVRQSVDGYCAPYVRGCEAAAAAVGLDCRTTIIREQGDLGKQVVARFRDLAGLPAAVQGWVAPG